MLVKYNVSNYKSIAEEQEFSMLANSSRDEYNHIVRIGNVNILKETALFGSNAGGKTNFVNSMKAARDMIVDGDFNDHTDSYCRIGDHRDEPSKFEFLIEINNRFVSYGFQIVLSKKKIVSEWMYEYDVKKDSDMLIYEIYEGNNGYCIQLSEQLNGEQERLRMYLGDISENYDHLFLNDISHKKMDDKSCLQIFRTVFDWFDCKLRINSLDFFGENLCSYYKDLVSGLGNISDFRIVKEEANEEEREQFLDWQRQYGKVSGLRGPGLTIYRDSKDGRIMVEKLYSTHCGSDIPFSFDDESEGTKQFLHMLPVLKNDYDDCTYVLDEFGSKMHPRLAYRFMELYEKSNRDKANQLIIATHHTSLMDSNLFRHDEMWFVDMYEGHTVIFSLSEFNFRNDKKVGKAYFEGRFGALPVFGNLNLDKDG